MNNLIVKKRTLINSLLCLVLVCLVSCAPTLKQHASDTVKAATTQVAFAMPDPYSADAVEAVLVNGGNAIDASVAAAFVLAVVAPEAGNIGGGGFLLARMNNELHFLDYREKAPLKASRDMYLDEHGEVIQRMSIVGSKAAGVPGTVAGLWQAHQKFGSMPWAQLIAPAIKLAEEGYIPPKVKASEVPSRIKKFGKNVNFKDHFSGLQYGTLFKQPDLAKTLKRIADNGRDEFYHGETAKLLVEQMERSSGLISMQDLAEYQAVWRKPLVAKWRDYTIASSPPPSSGGFAVIQLLKMKQVLAKNFVGLKHNSAQYVHLIAEMEKRVFADRALYFGDPDFFDVPIDALIDERYITKRAQQVNPTQISHLDAVPAGLESPDTTHFSIIDKWGNAVSNTYTLNWPYGCGVVVEGAGFILNNEMDDFSSKSGVPNKFGVVGGTANGIEPGKRMLSSMSPTLLIKNNQVNAVVGSPGGSTIFTSVFQAITNVKDYGMTAKQAVGASRFHHQLLPPDLITTSISVPFPKNSIADLQKNGYRVKHHAWDFGDVQMIIRNEDGTLDAASDPRNHGAARVVNLAD